MNNVALEIVSHDLIGRHEGWDVVLAGDVCYERPMAERVEAIAAAVEVGGAQVVRFAERDLGEPLSIFALTAVVQCIALNLAEARGTNPDRFRYDEDPGRERAFESIGF